MSTSGRRSALELEDVRSAYGRIEVLHSVSLAVRAGEIATLVGANGAGKTTVGITVPLVEQNARAALSIADRGYVIESGRVTAAGSAAALMADDRVSAAYLGVKVGRRVEVDLYQGAPERWLE